MKIKRLSSEKIFVAFLIIIGIAEIVYIWNIKDKTPDPSIEWIIAGFFMVLINWCVIASFKTTPKGKHFYEPEGTDLEKDPEKRKLIMGLSSKLLGAFSFLQAATNDYKLSLLVTVNLIAALLISILQDFYSYKLGIEKGEITNYDDKNNQDLLKGQEES